MPLGVVTIQIGSTIAKMAKSAVSGDRPGWETLAILSRQALIHDPRYPLWSHALGYCLLSHWLLTVHRGDDHTDRAESNMRCKGGDHGPSKS